MIPAERSHLHVAASTHPGRSGKNNEDRHSVSAYRLETDPPIPVTFAVLSDGIGGHRAGEVAAEIVVEKTSQMVARSDGSTPIQTLKDAIQETSRIIYTQSERQPENKGMGATCACAWIIGDRLYIAYVGDSRIYLIRKNTITQLSKDHTWVQEAIDAGLLKQDQSQNHPNAHVIRRYLGSKQPVEPDSRMHLALRKTVSEDTEQGLPLLPGDQIILCSDGLTDLVDQDEIRSTLTHMDQNQALDQLTDQANQRGGHDNITIIALKVPDAVSPAVPVKVATAPARATGARRLWRTCLLAFVLFGGMTVLALGGYFYLKYLVPASSTPTVLFINPSTQATTIPGATSSPSVSPTVENTSTPIFSEIVPTPESLSKTAQPTLTAWPTNTLLP